MFTRDIIRNKTMRYLKKQNKVLKYILKTTSTKRITLNILK